MSREQRRVMTSIQVCRTAALGGHLERCDQCGYERNAYNSCRSRHCPKCQCLARAQWLQDRQSELLDCPYFHVVFTLPAQIAAIAYQNKELVYGILFQHHPHLHCVVPGGGLSPDGQRWVSCRSDFFLPVQVLSLLFR